MMKTFWEEIKSFDNFLHSTSLSSCPNLTSSQAESGDLFSGENNTEDHWTEMQNNNESMDIYGRQGD